jgi:predicted aldo/keto reductase-like oxidoreductase
MIPTLNRAAEVGFVDVIMLKYNFRSYDDADLNRALDRCAKAGIGLVAMKTQGGAEASFQDRVDPFKEKGFNQYQAALKAVWQDDRMHTIVSAMKNVKQVRENTTAAREKRLGAAERDALERYAKATDHLYCRGCAQNCEPCVDAPVQIADTLRYRMYHNNYGDVEEARALFRQLPAEARQVADLDFSAAEAACPYRLAIGDMMREAARKLA